MDDDSACQNVLGVFAQYGFRKTSMLDLAEATGVSRQTLYNRFRTKDAVLDWAVQGYVREAGAEALAELEASDTPIAKRLLKAFSRWIGETVPIMRNSPHGAEIMDLGIASLERSSTDPHLVFERTLARHLLDSGICDSAEDAEDTTFLLLMAAKGLLLKSASHEEFDAGMERVIRCALPDRARSQ